MEEKGTSEYKRLLSLYDKQVHDNAEMTVTLLEQENEIVKCKRLLEELKAGLRDYEAALKRMNIEFVDEDKTYTKRLQLKDALILYN